MLSQSSVTSLPSSFSNVSANNQDVKTAAILVQCNNSETENAYQATLSLRRAWKARAALPVSHGSYPCPVRHSEKPTGCAVMRKSRAIVHKHDDVVGVVHIGLAQLLLSQTPPGSSSTTFEDSSKLDYISVGTRGLLLKSSRVPLRVVRIDMASFFPVGSLKGTFCEDAKKISQFWTEMDTKIRPSPAVMCGPQ
ncbi:hypothetical protein BKA93DRAFT_812749 [Sparassis latifolia]